MLIHEEKKFNCKVCDKTLRTKEAIKSHVDKINENKIKVFKCESCEKEFSAKNSLKEHHKSIHLSQKNFKCEKCPKDFTSKHTSQIRNA